MRTLLLRSASGGSHPHHDDEGRRRSTPTTQLHTMSDTYILNDVIAELREYQG
uniref:hypothetical protein n=1 Tax=Prevotella sp. TaxID=59823 RepID=UPI0040281540